MHMPRKGQRLGRGGAATRRSSLGRQIWRFGEKVGRFAPLSPRGGSGCSDQLPHVARGRQSGCWCRRSRRCRGFSRRSGAGGQGRHQPACTATWCSLRAGWRCTTGVNISGLSPAAAAGDDQNLDAGVWAVQSKELRGRLSDGGAVVPPRDCMRRLSGRPGAGPKDTCEWVDSRQTWPTGWRSGCSVHLHKHDIQRFQKPGPQLELGAGDARGGGRLGWRKKAGGPWSGSVDDVLRLVVARLRLRLQEERRATSWGGCWRSLAVSDGVLAEATVAVAVVVADVLAVDVGTHPPTHPPLPSADTRVFCCKSAQAYR